MDYQKALIVEKLRVFNFFKFFNDRIKITVHYSFDFVEFFVDTVVGDAILGKVVSANFFRAFAGADLFAAKSADFGLFLKPLLFVEFGAENA